MQYPIIDLHCDLTSYLDTVSGSTVFDKGGIGCAVPHLIEGGVALQVMAVFALTEKGSVACGERQFSIYESWGKGAEPSIEPLNGAAQISKVEQSGAVKALYAIENSSCFAEENEALENAMTRLETIMDRIGKPLYITTTHHAENRFGGGNLTDIGLKDDGKRLLEFMAQHSIAVDFSHTCDRYAEEILAFLDTNNLVLPVLASHSNFRDVCGHARNLPEWLADEIHKRGGVIGLNLVREFIDPKRPEAWLDHLQYGIQRGYRMAWGADYFSPAIMPPQFAFRLPYFHPAHDNATCYPRLMNEIKGIDNQQKTGFAWRNALNWMKAGR